MGEFSPTSAVALNAWTRAWRVAIGFRVRWKIVAANGDINKGDDRNDGEVAIMDDEAVPFGQTVQVVDPDVRAHVYSLVTAVSLISSIPYCLLFWLVALTSVAARRVQWRRC